ncbi:MAG: M50 family metallopeptidase, partial [Promethearchaeota archaeon]
YGWITFMLAGIYVTAFLFHEFGHRQVAKHFKLQTKFRLLTFGMIITLFSLIAGLLKIPIPSLALPGAVVVLGLEKVSKRTGLCKAAGPSVNLVYGIILLVLSFLVPFYPLNFLFVISAYLNFMLGAFNMIPIGILDGQNIWKWNKKVYILLASSLVALLIITLIFQHIPQFYIP